VTTRFDLTAPIPAVADLGRVHVLAIGGAGMSAVARLLLAAGRPVSGADQQDSAVLRAVEAAGARVWVGHDAAHLDGVDTVVVSSAIREDNVELVEARRRGLVVLHRSQALAALMTDRRSVAVAGANGKTTTSSMLATALTEAGADPSYAIGGDLLTTGTNAALGGGPAFVAEADESDGSFLVYRPDVAVVTNVQPDHLDFYGTFEAVQEAYAAFAATVRPGGLLVACADDPGSARLAQRAAASGLRVLRYGQTADADVRVAQVAFDGLSCRADLVERGAAGAVRRELTLAVPGLHNVLNATAAYVAATAGLGADPAAVLAGLARFRGARRRFEAKGEVAGVRVVDDYAHNPGKVAAVVGTAARLARPGRLVVAFQPHLYSRTRDFADAFGAALAGADVLVVTDVFAAREDPIAGVTGELVADAARRSGSPRVSYVADVKDLGERLERMTEAGDLVLTVGAGDITAVGPALLQRLQGRVDG